MVHAISFTKYLLLSVSLICHPSISQAQVFTGFTLIQTPGTSLGPVPATINLANVGTSLSINAEAAAGTNIAKVVMWFDGKLAATEYVTPYALGGNTDDVYRAYTPLSTIGTHTLVAEAYNAQNGSLGRKSITFNVVKSTSPVPQATPIRAPAPVPQAAPIRAPVVPVRSPVAAPTTQPAFNIIGEVRKWHKVTVAFTGPFARETDAKNPFMDYRLDVVFRHAVSGKQFQVPGHFAADGNAAETSASSGDQWHCHFAPDETGVWTFVASFVTGTDIAVSTAAGTPTSFHGETGTFTIQNTNKTGRDHRGKGRLEYVGQHHLQFQETGEWFLKAGPDRYER